MSYTDDSRDEADQALAEIREALAPLGASTSLQVTHRERVPATLEPAPLDVEAKQLVILATMRTGRPLAAAESLGYAPLAMRRALRDDATFAEAIEAAQARRVESMEAAVDRRAFEGIEETRYTKDGDSYTTTVFSDRLAELRLKGEAPDKYAARTQAEVKSTNINVLVVPPTASDSSAWASAWNAPGAVDVTPEAAPLPATNGDG